MRLGCVLLAAGLLFAAEDEPTAEEKKAKFLARLTRTMQSVRSFRAEFVQEKKLAVFREPVRSRGVLRFERPDRMRWETRKPFRSLLIVNGAKVAKFEWVKGKRRKLKLGRGADALLLAMKRLQAWFGGRFDEKSFTIELKSKPATHLVLRPRDKSLRKRIERMEFHPAKDLKWMQRVIVVEAGGDRTTLTFENYQPNRPAPKNAFSTTEPAPIDE